MILSAFTFVHVAISVIGILSGLVVVLGMISGKRLDGWTRLFLTTTVLTSVTGFLFPFKGVTPGDVVGVISLAVLMLAIRARYRRQLAGGWRRAYVISAVIALYFNVFVLVVQLFEKVPALTALAPKQNEPPFVATQVGVMATFIVLGILAARNFREEAVSVHTQTRAA